jgi:hypothetical protein
VSLHGLRQGTKAERRNLQSEFWQRIFRGLRGFFADHWKGLSITLTLLTAFITSTYFIGSRISHLSAHTRALWGWSVILIPPGLVVVLYLLVLAVAMLDAITNRVFGRSERNIWEDIDHGGVAGYVFVGLLVGVVFRVAYFIAIVFYQYVSRFRS